MPFYYSIDGSDPEEKRIAEGLLRLKHAFVEEKLPTRTVDETLLLATWNIREFDSTKYGFRNDEPLLYIAEIVSRFDLVAVQEVRDDLRALNRLMNLLGGWWKNLLTDVTEGTQGNRERMAFIYDSRKITFGGLAGEIVIPPIRKAANLLEPARQLVRSPFMVGFRAGWFRFAICTTHILYGKAIANEPERIKEIEALASFLAKRAGETTAWAKNMILLGDFNIFDTSDQTMKAITDQGFVIPQQIQRQASNALRNKFYDQVAFIAPDFQDRLALFSGGVFEYYKYVYRDEDEELYKKAMGEGYLKTKQGVARDKAAKTRYYKDWRTHQMSDHLPLWIELKIDFSQEYLARKVAEELAPAPITDPMAPGGNP